MSLWIASNVRFMRVSVTLALCVMGVWISDCLETDLESALVESDAGFHPVATLSELSSVVFFSFSLNSLEKFWKDSRRNGIALIL